MQEILIRVTEKISKINGATDNSFEATLLAPISAVDESEEAMLSKNNSSVILQIKLGASGKKDACRFLTGGDAEVEIWEKLWGFHERSVFEYDILQAPHHCSWHSLSHDSWSECGGKAKVSDNARNALCQALKGAYIVASSNPIKDDDNDPPCIRAKREYSNMTCAGSGKIEFLCVGDKPEEILEIEITLYGVKVLASLAGGGGVAGSGTAYGEPIPHG